MQIIFFFPSFPSLFSFSILHFADIGPFSIAAGINRSHFAEGVDELPKLKEFKNGLVLELYSYLSKGKKKRFYDRNHHRYARKLIELHVAGASVNESILVKYVSRLREKHAKSKRNVKGEAREQQLTSLLHEQFLFSRETHRKTPVPDTPVKKKLRMELKKSKAEAKGMKRKLIEYEAREEELRDTLEQERVTTEEEIGRLQVEVQELVKMNEDARQAIQHLTASFDPCKHELSTYKTKYNQKLAELSGLEEKLAIKVL